MNVVAFALAVGLVLTPAASSPAQRPPKVQRVGLLMQATPAAASHIAARSPGALRELGHVEGKNAVFEFRWVEGPEGYPTVDA